MTRMERLVLQGYIRVISDPGPERPAGFAPGAGRCRENSPVPLVVFSMSHSSTFVKCRKGEGEGFEKGMEMWFKIWYYIM